MKTTIIIASLLGLFTTGTLSAGKGSQDSLSKNQKKTRFSEMGLDLYSLDLVSSDYYFQADPKVVRNTFLNGVYYKYFKGRNALRTSLHYNEKTIDYGERMYPMYWNYTPNSISTLKKGDINVGYQRMFSSRRFSAYFFAELHYSYSQQKGSSDYFYYYLYSDSYYINYPHNSRSFLIERSQLGITKGLGLRWNVTNFLVLNLETSAEYYYYLQQDIKNSTYKQRGIGLNFKPVQFSVGFKF